MSFDWHVSLGTLIELGVLLITGIGLYRRAVERVASLEAKMDLMYDWFKASVVNQPRPVGSNGD